MLSNLSVLNRSHSTRRSLSMASVQQSNKNYDSINIRMASKLEQALQGHNTYNPQPTEGSRRIDRPLFGFIYVEGQSGTCSRNERDIVLVQRCIIWCFRRFSHDFFCSTRWFFRRCTRRACVWCVCNAATLAKNPFGRAPDLVFVFFRTMVSDGGAEYHTSACRGLTS